MKTLLWTGLLLGVLLTVARADPQDAKPAKDKATDVKKETQPVAKPDPDKGKADRAADAAKAKADRAADRAKAPAKNTP